MGLEPTTFCMAIAGECPVLIAPDPFHQPFWHCHVNSVLSHGPPRDSECDQCDQTEHSRVTHVQVEFVGWLATTTSSWIRYLPANSAMPRAEI